MAAKKKAAKAVARGRAKVKAAARKVTKRVEPIPKGYHSLTPNLVVQGAADAIEFYKRAFGAKEKGGRMSDPSGKVLHAEIQIGDSIVMLSDEFPQMGSKAPPSLGGTPSSLMIYVRDVDSAFQKAVAAGAKVKMPVADMFWGDRYGTLEDPFGHMWALGTRKENLTPRETARRMQEAMSRPPPQP